MVFCQRYFKYMVSIYTSCEGHLYKFVSTGLIDGKFVINIATNTPINDNKFFQNIGYSPLQFVKISSKKTLIWVYLYFCIIRLFYGDNLPIINPI